MSIRRLLLGISPAEATFERRGFHAVTTDVRIHLEEIGGVFLRGYHAAIDGVSQSSLPAQLDGVVPEYRGFAYEGASMGMALLDLLTPWSPRRWPTWSSGPADRHIYMLHVGAGWAAARIPWIRHRLANYLQRFDPLLRWLVIDGYGFHQGYFYPQVFVDRQTRPRRMWPYAQRVFDQGLGRSLWFVCGADVQRIADRITKFEEARRGDLWSGVGLACTYAGGVGAAQMRELCELAGGRISYLAQGAVFAATARERAGIGTRHTDLACNIIAALPPIEMASIATTALDRVRDASSSTAQPTHQEPDYEMWRNQIRQLVSRRRQTQDVKIVNSLAQNTPAT